MMWLLDLLDEELSSLAAGSDHDYTIMANIIDYFNHYPNTYHHPFEDKVFEWIRDECPSLSGMVSELRADHESQSELGRDLLMLVTAIQSGHMVPREKLVAELELFIEVQRSHINKEERYLFKEAEGVLTGLHLSEIPIPDRAALDPLFGQSIDSNFAALAARVERRHDSSSGDAAVTGKAK